MLHCCKAVVCLGINMIMRSWYVYLYCIYKETCNCLSFLWWNKCKHQISTNAFFSNFKSKLINILKYMLPLVLLFGEKQKYICISCIISQMVQAVEILPQGRQDISDAFCKTKWPTFSRQHFQKHFLEWQCLSFEYNLTEVCSELTIAQHWFR